MATYGKKSSFKKTSGFEKKSYGNKSYTKKTEDSGGNEGKSGFVGIGSIMPSKADAEEDLVQALKGSGLRLWWKVFLPKGVNQVTLQRGDRVMISFQTFKDEPEFVMGHVALPPESEE